MENVDLSLIEIESEYILYVALHFKFLGTSGRRSAILSVENGRQILRMQKSKILSALQKDTYKTNKKPTSNFRNIRAAFRYSICWKLSP